MSQHVRYSLAQVERLRRFNASACVDLHCHLLHGLDDGPETLDESVDLARALVDDGVTHVVATPHQLGRYEMTTTPALILERATQLRDAIQSRGLPLELVLGADVRVDEDLPHRIAGGSVLTVAGGPYVLIELPHELDVPADLVAGPLLRGGWRPVLTHPERNDQLCARPDRLGRWVDAGALIQVTGGSVVGDFGPLAMEVSRRWLGDQRVHLIASDAHGARHRPPRMTAAIDWISKELSHEVARRLCIENPLKVIRGESVFTVRTNRGAVSDATARGQEAAW